MHLSPTIANAIDDGLDDAAVADVSYAITSDATSACATDDAAKTDASSDVSEADSNDEGNTDAVDDASDADSVADVPYVNSDKATSAHASVSQVIPRDIHDITDGADAINGITRADAADAINDIT